jgi:hypothetical protein
MCDTVEREATVRPLATRMARQRNKVLAERNIWRNALKKT